MINVNELKPGMLVECEKTIKSLTLFGPKDNSFIPIQKKNKEKSIIFFVLEKPTKSRNQLFFSFKILCNDKIGNFRIPFESAMGNVLFKIIKK